MFLNISGADLLLLAGDFLTVYLFGYMQRSFCTKRDWIKKYRILVPGVFEEMETEGFPAEVVEGIADSLDCNPVFRGTVVEPGTMILIMIFTIIVLGAVYLLMTSLPEREQ